MTLEGKYVAGTDSESDHSKELRYLAVDKYCTANGVDLTQKSILDFGSGQCKLVKYLAERDCYLNDYYPFDLRYRTDLKLKEEAEENSLQVVFGDLARIPECDLILAISVFQDFSSVKEVHQVVSDLLTSSLKEGGKFIATIRVLRQDTNLENEKFMLIPNCRDYFCIWHKLSEEHDLPLSIQSIDGFKDNYLVVLG